MAPPNLATLTDRRCFRPWRHATPSSAWSPPTVQMCHLSDLTGFLLSSTRQNGLQGPGGVGPRPYEPAMEPLGLQVRLRRSRRVRGSRRNIRRSGPNPLENQGFVEQRIIVIWSPGRGGGAGTPSDPRPREAAAGLGLREGEGRAPGATVARGGPRPQHP